MEKREIAFRGKRIDNGEWETGFYWHGSSEGSDNHYIYIEECDSDVRVDPATVGQFTGLEDKYGKKIFEGDIVDTGDEEEGYNTLPIVFHDGIFSYEYSSQSLFELYKMSVIGNIHDNPELLEES